MADRQTLHLPATLSERPATEHLAWHNEQVYLG